MPPASRGLMTSRILRYASNSPNVRRAAVPLPPLPARQPEKKISPTTNPARLDPDKPLHEKDSGGYEGGEREKNGSGRTWDFIPPSARRWIWRFFYILPPVAFAITEFPLEIMRVHGPSMAPLLNVNSSPELPETPDLILVQKNILFTARKKPIPGIPTWELQRGQLIVFHAPHKPEQMAVKRVVGIPGDRVQPLPGYPGGDEPVVVPYNHIWVEGDANSRDKSVDSNWYGPISQNLVVGFVKMVFTPWHAPVAIDWQKHDYPAKNSGRIEKDVVHDAKLDPDKKSMSEAFSNGAAARELAAIRRNRDELLNIMRDRSKFVKLLRIYGQAKEELEQHDPASEEVAQGLIDELERAFERVGLSKDGNQLPPPVRSSDESASKGESEQEIKQRRLKEYLQRQSKKDSAEIKNDSVDPFTMVTTS